jgi:Alternative complex III, ActD subunit
VSVYALYDTGEAAQRAVNALRATGVADADIAVISSEPMEDYEFSSINHRTLIWYIASAGGFVGLAFASWLTRMTEVAWPLPTGNMPIVAWWPNLIVMFELTMLGGILSAVGTLIVAGGLARKRPALYDPEVTNGRILVGVENPRDTAAIERALRSIAGGQIKTAI